MSDTFLEADSSYLQTNMRTALHICAHIVKYLEPNIQHFQTDMNLIMVCAERIPLFLYD